MNIQQYIHSLTDEEFEQLCTEYLTLHYKNKNITIHGTRLKKDGGKDIVGTAQDVPYEIWAECKRHNRALGLEKISKNVILVISKGINELIYFSTSDITRNAVKHVSIVAAKHNFSVTFIYGNRLYQELSILPRFQYGFEKSNEIIKNDLRISRFFSVFEDTEKYTEESELVLQRDNIFYIDIYLTNLYSATVSDVTCTLPKMADIIFHVPEIHNCFNMLQGSNRVIQIRAEVLSSYTVKHIPALTLKYKCNGHTYSKKVPGGFIDPTKLIYYPLVGENVQNFLSSKILPLLKGNGFSPIYMLNITGKSGTGKTRLLSEIINSAKSYNFQTLYCDAKKQNGFEILREFLCACLGLPYGTGNISCTLDDFSKIIKQYYGNSKVSEAVFSFVFHKKLDPDILYYLKEALLFFSCNIVGGVSLIWTIDNLQCLDKETLDIIYFLIAHLQECFPEVIFSLGTNTEIVPLDSQGFVNEFLAKINEYEDVASYVYTCGEMQNNDAKTLYYHAIPNLQGFDYFTRLLLNKSGKRPFDIIMLIHWFYDQNLINISTHNMVIPSKKEEIENFINKVPVKSKEIIDQRFQLQMHKKFSFDTTLGYFDAFKVVVKSILYFGGETPVDFLASLNIDGDMLFELSQSLFFKYMDKYPKIVFYHDNIYRYFEGYQFYQNDRSLSLKIIKWLNENAWYKSNLRTTAIFDCYIRASEYEEAVRFGISSISSECDKRNFQAVIHIGTELLKDVAPYIYSYAPSDVEWLADELAQELSMTDKGETAIYFSIANNTLTGDYNNEYLFHLFNSAGEEVGLTDTDTATGKQISDYSPNDTSAHYTVSFIGETHSYTLLLAKNTDKESQVVEALHKALPALVIVIVIVSVLVAVFYAWYITAPIKKISKMSRRMANMDFNNFCPVERTDEIGVLANSLNSLSSNLSAALMELKEANQKLQVDIDKEKELELRRMEFFSAASHELKTPITIIKGQLQEMLCGVGRYKDRETYLAQSLEVTNSLEKMVQELLTVSRIEAPQYSCVKTHFDFTQFLRQRLAAFDDLFVQKELSVAINLLPDIYIDGDMGLLQKVVDNLLGNAATYSPPGNSVRVNLRQAEEKVYLTIENTGVHIPEDDISKLFEPFYRVEQSRNRQTGGSGLGLYIVKTIINLHNAEVSVQNTDDGVSIKVIF